MVDIGGGMIQEVFPMGSLDERLRPLLIPALCALLDHDD